MAVQERHEVNDVALPNGRASIRVLGWLLAVGGAIGMLASSILIIERVKLLEDPSYTPSCSLNPVVSCGQVMESWQGSLFGFPNPIIGVAAFPIVVTAGIAVLAGARLPRWFWLGLNLGALAGVVFITWLFTQSVYMIGALCPYCMVVWIVTIPIFVYLTGYNLSEGHLRLPHRLRWGIVHSRGLITAVWYVSIAILITIEFWDRWYLVF
jgi:uncharacterized membrane protein